MRESTSLNIARAASLCACACVCTGGCATANQSFVTAAGCQPTSSNLGQAAHLRQLVVVEDEFPQGGRAAQGRHRRRVSQQVLPQAQRPQPCRVAAAPHHSRRAFSRKGQRKSPLRRARLGARDAGKMVSVTGPGEGRGQSPRVAPESARICGSSSRSRLAVRSSSYPAAQAQRQTCGMHSALASTMRTCMHARSASKRHLQVTGQSDVGKARQMSVREIEHGLVGVRLVGHRASIQRGSGRAARQPVTVFD